MLRPAGLGDDAPVLVYHRGGNGEFGAIRFINLYLRFSELAQQGFVVIGSNLREQDEFGGADVEDSRRILDIVKGMDNVDLNRIALWGGSRGATQMMQVARGRDDVHALVFSVGAADSERALVTRPEMLSVYQQRVPNFEENRDQAMYDRSVVNWIDEVPQVPILILHGEQDDSVDVEQAHILAAALDEHDRDYTLNIYPDLGHNMMGEPTDDMMVWLSELFGTE
ncbi:MAG: prolyl oligopeptidase family serine peptidase [Idiomarina sp.]|nr:prolyl oligopeptidase family serine peptidase [Idiomarina sp.]